VSHHDNGYDERLLLVILAASLALFAFFAAMPVLRLYYALLMPAVIAIGAGVAWALLRSGRLASPAPRPTSPPDSSPSSPSPRAE